MKDGIASMTIEMSAVAGRTILVVFAHPDDESLACGGTLAGMADAGAHTVLLCASRGEKGALTDPALLVHHDLGRTRTEELYAAARALGIRSVRLLRYPDGHLRWGHAPDLQADILDTIIQWKPDAVITFDRDGLYWHPDHIGVHERTLAAVLSLGVSAPALYYVTMPQGAMLQVVSRAVEQGWTNPKHGLWAIPPGAFGLHADPPTLRVDVRQWVGRKLAALACHRTQLGATNPFSLIGAADARLQLGFEYFRRSPIPGSRALPLEQLAESAPVCTDVGVQP